jgi:signal transduction histidine kinase
VLLLQEVARREETQCFIIMVMLIFEVENAGSSIPPVSVAPIFEPFFTTKAQGTGPGFAIARKIACAHGGDLVLTANGPDRFCFTSTFRTAQENPHPT